MRIPFSIFLMPIYWFALTDVAVDPKQNVFRAVLIFIVLHLLVYPASNGYNSFYDKDEDSVGGLAHPPKVTKHLYYMVVAFDLLSVLVALFVNAYFALAVVVYLLISKAYSYDKIRLKKHPILSTLVVALFQGMFVYLAVIIGINGSITIHKYTFVYALVATLFLLGSYPITQIYQHKADAQRGDKTLSMLLGVDGTFLFSALFFTIASVLYIYMKLCQNLHNHVLTYIVVSLPTVVYFGWWFLVSLKDKSKINFHHTMVMNKISSLSMSLIFILNLFL
ncbi:MAG TPA: UbiA family prenyltransferase [Cytophagales bacterium]|nr:UbiA family prenyltransferase [Cytophagales bacterium]